MIVESPFRKLVGQQPRGMRAAERWTGRWLWLLLVGTSAAVAVPTGPDCTGPYYWADGFRICLDRPAENWMAIAFSERPDAMHLETLRARLEASDVKALIGDRPFNRYGLVLVDIAKSTSTTSDNLLRMLAQGQGKPLEILPVFRHKQSLFVLVNNFTVRFRATSDDQAELALLQRYGAKIERPCITTAGYIVSFPQMTPVHALDRVNALHQEPLVRYAKPNFEVFMPHPGFPPVSHHLQCAPSTTTTGPSDGSPPVDPHFVKQWYLDNDGSFGRKKHADINAVNAWSITTGSASVIVAILDEGVETTHEDLPELVSPYDATDCDDVQEPQDRAAHGTACAGIAAAVTGNKFGIKGIGAGISIMPIRIAQQDSNGGWNLNPKIIADGIRMAVDRGAAVLSASWWYPGHDSDITDAIDYALTMGRVVVFAAGNYEGPVDYPASLAETRPVIAVSATNEWDQIKTFKSKDNKNNDENWGSNYGDAITLAAPGVHMFTTDLMGCRGATSENYMPNFRGTSAAVPLVAGTAALIRSQDPTLTPAQVIERLTSTAKRMTLKGKPSKTGRRNQRYGWGRLDACRALGGSDNDCARRH